MKMKNQSIAFCGGGQVQTFRYARSTEPEGGLAGVFFLIPNPMIPQEAYTVCAYQRRILARLGPERKTLGRITSSIFDEYHIL